MLYFTTRAHHPARREAEYSTLEGGQPNGGRHMMISLALTGLRPRAKLLQYCTGTSTGLVAEGRARTSEAGAQVLDPTRPLPDLVFVVS